MQVNVAFQRPGAVRKVGGRPQLPGFVTGVSAYADGFIALRFSSLKWLCYLIGFLSQCNVITNSLGLRFLHVTDVIVILGLPILLINYIRYINGFIFSVAIAPLVLAWLLGTFFVPWGIGEYYTTAFSFIYALFSILFVFVIFKNRMVSVFCWGVLGGFIAASVLLFGDMLFHDILQRVGLSFPFDAQAALHDLQMGDDGGGLALRLEKAGGIWSAGNEAGPAFALAAAAAAHLSEQNNKFKYYLTFLAIYIQDFTLTLNRSGMVAVILIGLALYIRIFSMALLRKSALFLMVVIIGLSAAVPIGMLEFNNSALVDRFTKDDNLSSNESERVSSTLGGIEIMFENPLGIDVTTRRRELSELTGLRTPHNGFLATSYSSGFLYVVFMISALLYVIFSRRKVGFFFYSAICVLVTFMFEELNFNPAFMLTLGMIFGYMIIDLDFSIVRGVSTARSSKPSIARANSRRAGR